MHKQNRFPSFFWYSMHLQNISIFRCDLVHLRRIAILNNQFRLKIKSKQRLYNSNISLNIHTNWLTVFIKDSSMISGSMSSVAFSGNSKPRFSLLSLFRDENTNPLIDGALIRKKITTSLTNDRERVFIFISFFFS